MYIALASWDDSLFGSPPTQLPNPTFHQNAHHRPVNIHHYITATCTYNHNDSEQQCQLEWTFVQVSWLFPHPKRHHLGKPAELWCSSVVESFGMHCFVPFDLLLCRCAFGPFTIDEEVSHYTISMIFTCIIHINYVHTNIMCTQLHLLISSQLIMTS